MLSETETNVVRKPYITRIYIIAFNKINNLYLIQMKILKVLICQPYSALGVDKNDCCLKNWNKKINI